MAVPVETWIGIDYDEEGNVKEKKRYTAKKATDDIDPKEIKKAIENIKESCDEKMKDFNSTLKAIEPNAEEAIRIEGTTLKNYITDIKEVADSAGKDIATTLDPLVEKAQEKHDELQKKYNEEAHADAKKHQKAILENSVEV